MSAPRGDAGRFVYGAVVDDAEGYSTEGLSRTVTEMQDEISLDSGQFVTEYTLEGLGHLIYDKSISFYAFMILGGVCSPSSCSCCVWLYTGVWVFAYVLCGSMCLWNCWVRDPPFHFMPVDATVAFVHLPGLANVIFWRWAFSGRGSTLWSAILSVHDRRDTWDDLCRCASYLGLIMIPLMLFTTGLVFAGVAYPAMVAGEAMHHDFSRAHALIMWVVIPPVVCNVLANAAFFGFMLHAHCVHVNAGRLKLERLCWAHRPADGSAHMVRLGDRGAVRAIIGHPSQPRTLTPMTFGSPSAPQTSDRERGDHNDDVIVEVFQVLVEVQDHLDSTCVTLGPSLACTLFVAMFSLLAVLCDVRLAILTPSVHKFTRFTVCVDLFLCVKSMLEVCGCLLMAAYTTHKVDQMSLDCINAMLQCGVPASTSLPLYSYLQTAGRWDGPGFKLCRLQINGRIVAAFFSGMASALGIMVGMAAAAS